MKEGLTNAKICARLVKLGCIQSLQVKSQCRFPVHIRNKERQNHKIAFNIMLKISTLIVNAMLLSSFVQFPIPLVEGKISAHHLRMQLPGLTIEADEFSIKLTGNLSPLIVNQAGGRAGGIHHPVEVVEPGVRGRGKEEKEMRGQGMPRRGGKQFGYLRKNGPSCGPGSARGSAGSRRGGAAR
jgi:hypothetical protein